MQDKVMMKKKEYILEKFGFSPYDATFFWKVFTFKWVESRDLSHNYSTWFLPIRLRRRYRYRNSVLVTVPDIDTEFRSDTTFKWFESRDPSHNSRIFSTWWPPSSSSSWEVSESIRNSSWSAIAFLQPRPRLWGDVEILAGTKVIYPSTINTEDLSF